LPGIFKPLEQGLTKYGITVVYFFSPFSLKNNIHVTISLFGLFNHPVRGINTDNFSSFLISLPNDQFRTRGLKYHRSQLYKKANKYFSSRFLNQRALFIFIEDSCKINFANLFLS